MNKKGLVIKAVSSFFYIKYDHEIIECKSSKKLKQNKEKILPGDIVIFDYEKKYITDIQKRKSQLIRPQIANVENSILVFSVKEPKMNFNLLDKLLMIMDYNNLESIILVTKMDLLNAEEKKLICEKLSYYGKIGYRVLYNHNFKTKKSFIQKIHLGEKYVITGQSGVGKSTFLNQILNLNIKTQEISLALGRGKHTTRETIFYEIETDTYLIDTPGFSSLELKLSKEEKRDNFRDFEKLTPFCKFKMCFHHKEPKCAVKKAVENSEILESRYKNYLKILEEE